MNIAILSGNLGQDPELRHTQSGLAVLSFSLATSRRRKQGEQWIDETTWHRVKMFGTRAEALERHLSKGAKVIVHGRIHNYVVENEHGKRSFSEVVAENLEFAQRKDASGGGRAQHRDDFADDFGTDDIPF